METLEQRLGYKFRNSLLLAEALTHPSLAYETQRPHFDNQRLEFLGDAVLQLALTDHLYTLFPGFAEGDLTKMRARLVSKQALTRFAKQIHLGEYVLLGKGEESSGGRKRASTLADAFEAILGAVYLDGGFDTARDLVLKVAEQEIKKIAMEPEEKNPKGKLQEILQAIQPESPVYRVTSESGPDHDKQFEVEVTWQSKVLACGKGRNKKEAEASAASKAMEERVWES
ncbi:RNAse III [Rubritalea squalenifaciens DSM 18772]|uniref:Ribonuclease 3 n=2 Tax=Rubritalea TaxID=361050 RepID=A0A1M6PYG7_9BACT|nr:ribonuclease III [Rubritalea squalenifaciens]SHK12989.1 RNAse III [Rubritalea squalenifaciens DSM 18772]